MPELSILLITRNEAPRLPAFFDALRMLDLKHEVLVLDSKSTDGTQALAAKRGAKVRQVQWKGYAQTKNEGFALAKAPWILSLDADEFPDTELCRGISRMVREGNKDAYELNRLNYFLGRPVWRGGWHPDWHLRLFKKGAARFNERLVHEGMEAGPGVRVGRVRGILHHHSYPDLEGYFSRLNRYTTLQAREIYEKKGTGPLMSILRMVLDPPLTFLKMYVLKAAFLEGKRGLALALLSGSSTFWKYAKLWHLGWTARGGKAGKPWVASKEY